MCARDGAAFRTGPILLTMSSMFFGIISILGVAVRWGSTSYPFPAGNTPNDETAEFGLQGARFSIFLSTDSALLVSWDDTYEQYEAVYRAILDCDSGDSAVCDLVLDEFSKVQTVGRATFAFMIIAMMLSFVGLTAMLMRRYTSMESKHLKRSGYAFLFASAAASIIGLLVWDQEFIQKSNFAPKHGVGVGLAGFSATLILLAAFMQVLWQKVEEPNYEPDDFARKNTVDVKGAEINWT